MAEEKEAKGKERPAKEGDAAAAAPKAAGGSNKIIIIVICVVVVLVNAIVAFQMIQMSKPKAAAKEEGAHADSVKTEHAVEGEHGGGGGGMGEVIEDPVEAVVNIAGTDGSRFLKIKVLLCFEAEKYPHLLGGGEKKEKHGEGGPSLGAKKPLLKDKLMEVVLEKTMAELNEASSREKIRKEFLHKANSILAPGVGEFSNVLIDEFLIQ